MNPLEGTIKDYLGEGYRLISDNGHSLTHIKTPGEVTYEEEDLQMGGLGDPEREVAVRLMGLGRNFLETIPMSDQRTAREIFEDLQS